MQIQDSFLLDEVRCGFLIPATLKQAWAAQLEVLAEIDRVCKKHNIQYFADWGTLLGTVRHGGYIPWDDDLDIVMKREDFNKFMTVARFDMEEGFDVQTFRNQEDCWLFLGKVVGRNRFFFEKEHLRKFHNFPYIASVDVFVLDYVYRDPEKEAKRRNLCKHILAVADAIVEGSFTAREREHGLKTIEEMRGKRLRRIADPVEMGRYLYGEVEQIFAEVPEQEADYLTQLFPWGLQGSAFQFPKEYYEKSVCLPFECTKMPVPLLYDRMLRQRYGDYIRLVKTAGAHDYPFFEGQKKNLQAVLDFTLPEFQFESSKLCRREEEVSYRNLSYKAMAKECITELGRMKEELNGTIGQLLQAKEPQYRERAMELLGTSQQLAIDLGGLLEQMLGENCTTIPLLEQYCEELYMLYEQLVQDDCKNGEVTSKENAVGDKCPEKFTNACGRLDNIQKAITDDLEVNVLGRKTVLFLPVLSKDWKELDSLWQATTSDSSCEVYVVPLPYYYKDYDGSPRKVCCESEAFPEKLCVQDYKLLTAEYLELLHPEIIVMQNPYDSWNPAISVPEMFYSENLRKHTDKLIYVPPFAVEEYSKKNEREYFNMKYYVTMPGVVYADCVMVRSQKMRQVYIDKLVEFAGEETRDIWEQRVVAFNPPDMFQEHKHSGTVCLKNTGVKKTCVRKKVLYGISIGAYAEDAEAAQGKIKRSLQLFEEHGMDVTLWIFPGGDIVSHIREQIKQMLPQYQNTRLEEKAECAVEDYDVYFGDAMPLVMKFGEMGKPAMVQDIYL